MNENSSTLGDHVVDLVEDALRKINEGGRIEIPLATALERAGGAALALVADVFTPNPDKDAFQDRHVA